MLQNIGGGEHAARLRDSAGRLEPGLADLAKHYTMQSERDVHANAAGAADGAEPAAAPAEPGAFPSGEASELGENVELF